MHLGQVCSEVASELLIPLTMKQEGEGEKNPEHLGRGMAGGTPRFFLLPSWILKKSSYPRP